MSGPDDRQVRVQQTQREHDRHDPGGWPFRRAVHSLSFQGVESKGSATAASEDGWSETSSTANSFGVRIRTLHLFYFLIHEFDIIIELDTCAQLSCPDTL